MTIGSVGCNTVDPGCNTNGYGCNTVYSDGGTIDSCCYTALQADRFLCVIQTPNKGEVQSVEMVSPYRGGAFDYSSELCARSSYLPQGYVFSVQVYSGQFIHVKRSCMDGVCDCLHILDGVPAQLHPCRVAALMYKYRLLGEENMFVLTGLCRGFHILDSDVQLAYSRSNYSSILEPNMYSQMCATINRELVRGQISLSNDPAICVHSLGAVVRPDGRLRPITDCSRPSNSINNHMFSTATKFKFSRVEDTRNMVEEMGFGSVIDITNAYRSVLVYPPHRKYQGFNWEMGGTVLNFQDNALCFGLRSAPSIFNNVSSFITRIVHESGRACQGYLDDYLVSGSSWEECKANQEFLVNLLRYIEFEVNMNKVTEPSHTPKYLGVIIDLESMKFRLPEDKLIKTSKFVRQLLNCSWCTRKDLEKLAGLLAHCAVLVKGGRTFCRRLYGLLKATMGLRRVRLADCFKMDLKWWDSFLRVFDGTCDIFPCMVPTHHTFTDASGSGFGAWFCDRYLFGFWGEHSYGCPHVFPPPVSDDISEANINVKELWPVVAAVKKWGEMWRSSQVLLHSDNTQVVTMVATGRSRNPQAMELLRELFWCCSILQIDLRAAYISTNDNVRADRLSRLPSDVNQAKSSAINSYGLPLNFMSCCIHRPTQVTQEQM